MQIQRRTMDNITTIKTKLATIFARDRSTYINIWQLSKEIMWSYGKLYKIIKIAAELNELAWKKITFNTRSVVYVALTPTGLPHDDAIQPPTEVITVDPVVPQPVFPIEYYETIESAFAYIQIKGRQGNRSASAAMELFKEGVASALGIESKDALKKLKELKQLAASEDENI